MKITKLLLLVFLGIFIAGCASCVPGICGCSFSIWPSNWEEFVVMPAMIGDLIGLAGTIVCGIVLLILWSRHKTIADTARICAEQELNNEQP